MAQIVTTVSDLRSKEASLRDLNANFRKQVQALDASEADLKTKWNGPANDKFHAAFTNDKSFMTQFANEIDKYCNALETIATEYEKAEAANCDTASTRKY
jgi:WXG100 family type VII secretion target